MQSTIKEAKYSRKKKSNEQMQMKVAQSLGCRLKPRYSPIAITTKQCLTLSQRDCIHSLINRNPRKTLLQLRISVLIADLT